MGKLQYSDNKTLKLVNVLKYRLSINEGKVDFNVALEQMQSYIRTKGAKQIGPLIQYTKTTVNEQGMLEAEVVLMLQCNNFIHNVSEPYGMEPLIRVPNSLYCRYNGPENSLKLAFDKIGVEAFEADISLCNYNYIVFVSSDTEENNIVADVFVPRCAND